MPGEHPRLFFRTYDLPALRARAATADGAAWIGKLKTSLGGGEALRADLNSFTIGDAFGFGFLYQLTREQKYADACRQAVVTYMGGTPNKGGVGEYNWRAPSGYMDVVGPSVSSVAMAYDLCYDGWDEGFRTMVAHQLMTYQCPNAKIEGWPTTGDVVTLEQMAVTPPGDPGTWTFGPTVAGAGLVTLATMGDPGVDPAQSARLLAGVATNVERVFSEGWGDMGGFYRMAQQGQIVATGGFVPLMQAMRVALNKDYITDNQGAQWMTMHWVFDLMQDPKDTRPRYPDRHDAPSLVQSFSHFGLRAEGTFWQGFAAVRDDQKPALLWTYQTLNPEGGPPDYPQHAVFAFLNTPVGLTAKNPAEVIPHIMQDHRYGLYEFRNRWQDQNDILVTALLGGASDEHGTTSVTVWGFGFRTTFGSMPLDTARPRIAHETFVASQDGSGVLSVAGSSLAVDFGGTSGADALLAFVGARDDLNVDNMRHEDFGPRASSTKVMLGATAVYVMTLQNGIAPTVRVVGDTILVGNQAIAWNGSALVLTNMNP